MPKNLTRHRRAAKRGGQTAEAPAPYVAPAPAPMPTYVAPAPAPMPTYVAPAAAPAEEKSWFSGLGDTIGEFGAKLDPRKLLPSTGGRRRSRAMRGGNVNASDPLSLATNASPISGISSARAHNWVGGRTRAQTRSRSQGRSRRRAQSRSRRRAQSRSRAQSRKYRRARH